MINAATRLAVVLIILSAVFVTLDAQTNGGKTNQADIWNLVVLMEAIPKKVNARDLDGALTDSDRAMVIANRLRRPKVTSAVFLLRGTVYQARGDLSNAIADFTSSIESNKAYGRAYEARAESFLSNGESEKALEDAKKALSLDSNLFHSHAIISGVQFIKKEFSFRRRILRWKLTPQV